MTINATWLLLGSLSGALIAKLSQAFGPIRTAWFRIISEWLLRRVHIIISRGHLSTKELLKLSLRKPSVECSDLAFLLKESPISWKKEIFINPRGLMFGIAPSSVLLRKMGKKKYVDLIIEVIMGILANYDDSLVVLVAHSFRNEKTLSNNDAPVCKLIYEELPSKVRSRCRLFANQYTSGEMRSIIGCFDIFLACRFHAMVSALANGVPVGVIGWSHKYREVQHQFGIEFCIDQKAATTDRVLFLLQTLVNNKSQLRAKILTHLPSVIDSARNNFRVLEEFLLNRQKVKGLVEPEKLLFEQDQSSGGFAC